MFENTGEYSFYSALGFIIILILPLTSCCKARVTVILCAFSPVSEGTGLWTSEDPKVHRYSSLLCKCTLSAWSLHKTSVHLIFIVKGKASFIHTAHSHLRSLWGIYRRTKVCLQKSKNKRPVKILHFHVLAKNYAKLKRPKKIKFIDNYIENKEYLRTDLVKYGWNWENKTRKYLLKLKKTQSNREFPQVHEMDKSVLLKCHLPSIEHCWSSVRTQPPTVKISGLTTWGSSQDCSEPRSWSSWM